MLSFSGLNKNFGFTSNRGIESHSTLVIRNCYFVRLHNINWSYNITNYLRFPLLQVWLIAFIRPLTHGNAFNSQSLPIADPLQILFITCQGEYQPCLKRHKDGLMLERYWGRWISIVTMFDTYSRIIALCSTSTETKWIGFIKFAQLLQ